MSEPPGAADTHREELVDGELSIEFEPIRDGKRDGKIRLTALADGTILESAEFSWKVFGSQQLRGQFLNAVESALHRRDGIDPERGRRELKNWFLEMHNLSTAERVKTLNPQIQEIIEGTQLPVEIHGGEKSTWNVTLTFAGRTRQLDFTAGEMSTQSGGAALQEKLTNYFFELVEIQPEAWEAIRDYWHENARVSGIVEDTAEDAMTDRILEYLSDKLIPVDSMDKMANGVESCWYDAQNSIGVEGADADDPVLWVQGSFFADQIKAAGIDLTQRSELTKHLIHKREALYEGSQRRKWGWPKKRPVFPFDPDVLGISEDDTGSDEPAHSEVSA